MSAAQLEVVFLVSLVVVAAGLAWLWRHPRVEFEESPALDVAPCVAPPTLPSPALQETWAPPSRPNTTDGPAGEAPEASGAHLERAASQGDPEALLRLALEQDRRARDLKDIRDRDAFQQAFTLLQRAARTGHPQALMWVGRILRQVGRSEREQRAALDWLRLAAARGSPEAHLELGQCHMTGEGTPENRREAARWFRTGWELGSAGSAYLLAALARGRTGACPDQVEVIRWLEEAARLGHRAARRELLDRKAGDLSGP